MMALIVTFKLKSGMTDLFDELMFESIRAISADEPSIVTYVVRSVESDPRTRTFYEIYQDEAALAAGETHPATATFLRRREDLIESFTSKRLQTLVGQAVGNAS
jgi:quinol monooxygenase YgiN